MHGKITPRNPWLVLIWALGLMVILQLPQIIWMAASSSQRGQNSPLFLLGIGLLVLIVGLPLIWVTLRYLWRRPNSWIGVSPRVGQLVVGGVTGVLAPIPPLLILILLGVAEIETGGLTGLGFASVPLLIGSLLFFFYAAAAEEIVVRGMMAREIAVRWGWLVAWLISGVFFGLLHLQGGMSGIEMVWLVVSAVAVSGLFLALYLRGASLWLPTAFHAGWNFCLTCFLGATMSGNTSDRAIGSVSLDGPFLLTGGKFGMEISVVTVAFYGIYAVLALSWLRRTDAPLLAAGLPPDDPVVGLTNHG